MAEVLVLGGTGFVGVPLVERLLRARHGVTVLSRGTTRPAFTGPVEQIVGDRNDPASLRRAIAGRRFDAVIDNLAFRREEVADLMPILDGRTRRYILASSVVVYGHGARTNPAYEDDVDLSEVPDGSPPPAFGQSTVVGKRQAELVLWNALAAGRLPFEFTILRPAKIHGRHDPSPRLWWYMQRLHDGGPLVIPAESPDPPIRHVYCDDLAVAYEQVLEHPNAANQAYNIASVEVVPLSAFLAVVASALDRDLQVIRLPAALLEAQGFTRLHPLLATADLLPDVRKAQEHFGWRSTPLEQWVKELCDWYLGQVVDDSWGYDLRPKELELASRYAC